jgi:rhodanese-related sulfurtransferase
MRDGLPMKLVDLRGSDLFKAGTIPGARNVVAEKLADEAAGWPRDTLIVLFGGGDDTAVAQAELLRRAGFTMVRFLYGGYPEWKRLNAL